MKKIFKLLVLMMALLTALAVIVACDTGDTDGEGTTTTTTTTVPPQPDDPNGILYSLSKNGDHYSVLGLYPENTATEIVIPDTFNGIPITEIENKAFQHVTWITKITLGDNVTKIGNYAFDGCTELSEIVMGDRVETVGNWAFRNSGLATFEANSALNKISTSAFENCASLRTVMLSDSMREISNGAFKDCLLLEEVDLGEAVTVGENCFEGCDSLVLVDFGESLEKISAEAFLGCDRIGEQGLIFPESLEDIGESAFKSCTGLISFNVPTNLVKVRTEAFYGCTSLEEVTGVISLNTSYARVFQNCTSLEKIYIGTKKIGMTNYGITIGQECFKGCTSLEFVSIGDGVTAIPYDCFSGCSSIKSVIIPTSILTGSNWSGQGAWSGTANFEAVYFRGTRDQWIEALTQSNGTAAINYTGSDYFYRERNGVTYGAPRYYYSENPPAEQSEGLWEKQQDGRYVWDADWKTAVGNFWHFDSEGNPVVWQTAE